MGTTSWIFLGLAALFCLGGLGQLLQGPDRVKGLSSFVVGGLAVAIVFSFSGGAATSPKEPEDPAIPACRQDFRRCTSQEQLVYHYGSMTEARTSCKQAARKLARFGDADLPFFAFESYFRSDDTFKTGKISLVEKEAKYQNAFGPMQRMQVKCYYDLAAKHVIEVNAIPQ